LSCVNLYVRPFRVKSVKQGSGGEPFATLCKIWPVRDLNSRLVAHEARALSEAVIIIITV